MITRAYLNRIHGDRVQLEYADMDRPEVQEQYAEYAEEAQRNGWAFPLVIIGDEIRLAGTADSWYVVDLVQQQMAAVETQPA